MRDLAPCLGCRRLLRHRDAACPFCFTRRVVTFAAILPLSVACQRATVASDAGPGASATTVTTASVASVAPAASEVVPPLPALSASATPSAVASARQASIGRDGGGNTDAIASALAAQAASVFADAGLASLGTPGIAAYGSPGIGAYGAAPSPGLGALTAGNVSASLSGAKTTTDERVVAGRRAMMRACYTRGLMSDPTMKGTLKLHVTVGSDGSATAAKAGGAGLSADTEQCMVASLSRAQYDANAPHAFDVDVSATPTK